MAHKKGSGSTKNGRDSNSQRLGIKVYGNQVVKAGGIIVRQRGTKFWPGEGVGMGKDFTIYAVTEGVVSFTTKKQNRTYISVLPLPGIPCIKKFLLIDFFILGSIVSKISFCFLDNVIFIF